MKKITKTKPFIVLVVTADKPFFQQLQDMFDKSCHFIQSQPVDSIIIKACEILPDLILKDISKRKINNFQVFNSLKNDHRTHNIPVIILTEQEKPDNLEQYFNAGVSDNISKRLSPTEIKTIIKTHLELKQKIDENIEMNFVKTKFFSVMTNDIKDSLLGVKGVAGFLLNDLESNNAKKNEVVKMARILYEDSKELYKFLENLIEWASIETNKTEIKPEIIKLHNMVNEIIEHFRAETELKGVVIKSEIHQDIDMLTDKKALNFVLLQVISNAIKYSNKDGEIIIKAESVKKSSTTRITIQDFGEGMDSEVVKYVFRLDTPHPKSIGTRGEKGTGLGLIICRSIIDKIYGKIEIESKKHRGTIVKLNIPNLKYK